jgi:hypothetical protein
VSESHVDKSPPDPKLIAKTFHRAGEVDCAAFQKAVVPIVDFASRNQRLCFITPITLNLHLSMYLPI